MNCNLLPRTSGPSSAAFSLSALFFGTAKRIVATRPAVCQVLLLVLGWALCGEAAQAQTAYFGGAQSTLVNNVPSPISAAVDASGNVFFLQFSDAGAGVYEIPAGCASPGCIKTISTSGFKNPDAVAIDANGDLYVVDTGNTEIVRLTLSGGVYGAPSVIANSTSNPALNDSVGVAVDGSCNIYFAEATLTGSLFKLAPVSGGCSATTYTTSTVASELAEPLGVAVDAAGDVFVALNTGHEVFKYAAGTFAQSTVASNVTAPRSVAVDVLGNVYVGADNSSSLIRFTPNGSTYTQTNIGSGFSQVSGIAVGGNGNVFATDSTENTVSEIQTQGVNLGSSAVGTATAPQTLIFNFTNTTGTTIGAPVALTGGATGKDFASATGGTCNTTASYGTGDDATSSCTVNVTVKPAAAGLRTGAVELTTTSGAVIATAYVYGTGNGPQVAFLPGVQSTIVGSGLDFPLYVAVDGSGNLYIADFDNRAVHSYKFSAGSYTLGNDVANGTNLAPQGVAVDGSGDVYVADQGDGAVHKYAPNGSGGYTQLSDVANGANLAPQGLAVDGSGNVYVADQGDGAVHKYAPNGSGGYTQLSDVATGFSSPQGVAVDGSGNVYVVDQGNNVVDKYAPNGSGGYTKLSDVGAGLNGPFGVAVDAGGNVYIVNSGGNNIQKVDVSDPPSLTFAKTAIGSANGPQTVAVTNIGNQSLTIESNPTVAANFALDSSNNCGAETAPINQGASCALALDFTPTEAGSPLTGTAVLTTNNLNANTSPFAMQIIDLSGSTPGSTSTVVTSSANPSTLNGSVTFTATVTNTTNGASTAPTGSVQFVVDGTNSGSAVPLTAGNTTSTASLQLSNLTASGSSHTITANYLNSDGNFADSNGTLSGGQTVNQATTSLKLSQSVATPTVNVPDTLTAVISTASTTPIAPTGTVSFTQNGSSVTGCSTPQNVSLVGNSYQASCTATTLPAPSVAVIATYSGDNNFSGSSNPLNIPVVNKATPAYTLSATPQPPNASITVNVPVIFTAAFSSPISSLPTQPTGTIPVIQGGATLCTITLPATTCTYSSGFATAASFTVTSSYSGDSQFNTVTSGSIPVSVSATGTMTKVTDRKSVV